MKRINPTNAMLVMMMAVTFMMGGCKKKTIPPTKTNPLVEMVAKVNNETPKTVGDYTLVKAELSHNRLIYHFLLSEEQMKTFNVAKTREEVMGKLGNDEMKNLVAALKKNNCTLSYLYTDSINTSTFDFIPGEMPDNQKEEEKK